jgi:tetratricopeptide (TPR) repeat protein
MKTKILIAATSIVFAFTGINAQDVENCKANNSIFYEFAKNGNYADAIKPWTDLYNACPDYSKNIYKYGALILDYQISKEADPAKKEALVDELMKMYDNRIKYFGDDATLPAPRVLGVKALDYIKYPTSKDPQKKEAYAWLAKSIEGLGEKTDAAFIQSYIGLSVNYYKQDPKHLDALIQDFLKTNDILSTNITVLLNANDTVQAKYYAQVQAYNNKLVADTKALSAETLDRIYKPQVEQNKTNIDFLSTTIALYKAAGVTESPVYFEASVAAHKIQPTEESAVGCANMSLKKNDYAKCIEYLEEATTLSQSNKNKANYKLLIANYYDKLGNKQKARAAARESLDFDPNQGEPYILIGLLYAKTTGIYGDPVLDKSVYWAAVDKFIKAKQVDPSVADQANKLITQYSRLFPAKEEVFFQPDLEAGKQFTVGGWIGETTTCR